MNMEISFSPGFTTCPKCGSRDIASVFAKLRKPFMKKGMTTQRKKELMKNGTEMLMKDSLPNTPYTPEFMEQAYSSRRSSGMI